MTSRVPPKEFVAFRMPRDKAERLYHKADELEVSVSALINAIIEDRTQGLTEFSGIEVRNTVTRYRTKFLPVEEDSPA